MPAPMLKKLAKQANIPIKKAEEYWDKAKELAAKEGRDPDKDSKNWAYVVGIVKRMMGLTEEMKNKKLILSMIDKVLKGDSADEIIVKTWNRNNQNSN